MQIASKIYYQQKLALSVLSPTGGIRAADLRQLDPRLVQARFMLEKGCFGRRRRRASLSDRDRLPLPDATRTERWRTATSQTSNFCDASSRL